MKNKNEPVNALLQQSTDLNKQGDTAAYNLTNTSALSRCQALLGNQVFLPIPKGEKGPRFREWQKVNHEKMNDPEYLKMFSDGCNIGVLLNKHLVCLDFDNDQVYQDFTKQSPHLIQTTIIRGQKGVKLFYQIIDEPKPNNKLYRHNEAVGDWLSKGRQAVVYGVHPSGIEYQITSSLNPHECVFFEIEKALELIGCSIGKLEEQPIEKRLQSQYGPPITVTDKGNLASINQNYIAALIEHENLLIYNEPEKQFYIYQGSTGLWVQYSISHLRELISKRLLDIGRENGDEYGLINKRNKALIDSIISHLMGVCLKDISFNDTKGLIHLKNGMYDLKEKELKPFSPEYYSRNQIPIDYYPDAKCPTFLDKLIAPAMNQEDIALLQKFFGSCIIQENLAQRFLILCGEGGRGKSTLSNIISDLIGKANASQLRTSKLGDRFELYRVKDSTLLVGSDVSGDFLMDKGISDFKSWIGGDPLSAEGKGLNGSFPVTGDFNVIITCNERLRINIEGDLSAWERRLLIIPFNAPPPDKKIPNFASHLIEKEGAGILQWAIEGAQALLNDINAIGDYALAQEQYRRIESLLAESESLKHFLKDGMIKEQGHELSTAEIKEGYAEYCAEKGWNPMSDIMVSKKLPDLMLQLFHVHQSNSIQTMEGTQRGYRKVRFIEMTQMELPISDE